MNPLKFLLLSTAALPRDVDGAGMGGGLPADSGATPATDAPLDTGAQPQEQDNTDTQGSEPSLEEQLDDIWDEAHGEPKRGEGGRFVSRKPKSDAEGDQPLGDGDEPLGDEGQDPDHPGEDGAVKDPDGATDDMPKSWSKDKAETWKSLTPEAKEYIRQRETETTQALSRAGRAVNIVKNAQPVLDAVAPYTRYLNQVGEAIGKHPAALISDILRFENTLRTAPDNETKLEVVKDIVAEYGIDVSALIGAEASEVLRGRASQDITRHPEFVAMRRELQQLKSITIGERQQQFEAQAQEMETAITQAASDRQTFPHFERVRNTMASLIQAMPDDPAISTGELIRRAYDAACRADPDIFASIQRDQQRKDQERRQTEQRQRAQQARRASAPNLRTTPPSPSKQTMDQELAAMADKHYGRGN